MESVLRVKGVSVVDMSKLKGTLIVQRLCVLDDTINIICNFNLSKEEKSTLTSKLKQKSILYSINCGDELTDEELSSLIHDIVSCNAGIELESFSNEKFQSFLENLAAIAIGLHISKDRLELALEKSNSQQILVQTILAILSRKTSPMLSRALPFAICALVFLISESNIIEAILHDTNALQFIKLLLNRAIYPLPDASGDCQTAGIESTICRLAFWKLINFSKVQRNILIEQELLSFLDKWWPRWNQFIDEITPKQSCEQIICSLELATAMTVAMPSLCKSTYDQIILKLNILSGLWCANELKIVDWSLHLTLHILKTVPDNLKQSIQCYFVNEKVGLKLATYVESLLNMFDEKKCPLGGITNTGLQIDDLNNTQLSINNDLKTEFNVNIENTELNKSLLIRMCALLVPSILPKLIALGRICKFELKFTEAFLEKLASICENYIRPPVATEEMRELLMASSAYQASPKKNPEFKSLSVCVFQMYRIYTLDMTASNVSVISNDKLLSNSYDDSDEYVKLFSQIQDLNRQLTSSSIEISDLKCKLFEANECQAAQKALLENSYLSLSELSRSYNSALSEVKMFAARENIFKRENNHLKDSALEISRKLASTQRFLEIANENLEKQQIYIHSLIEKIENIDDKLKNALANEADNHEKLMRSASELLEQQAVLSEMSKTLNEEREKNSRILIERGEYMVLYREQANMIKQLNDTIARKDLEIDELFISTRNYQENINALRLENDTFKNIIACINELSSKSKT